MTYRVVVWATGNVGRPAIRAVAAHADLELGDIRTHVERRVLDRTVEVDGMGVFEAGTQGACRFEVQRIVDLRPLLVMEHVTRIDDHCAPARPTSTANRIVNAIPTICEACPAP